GAGAEAAVVDDGFSGNDLGSLHGAPSFWSSRPGLGGLRSRPTDRRREPTFREPLPRTGTMRRRGCGGVCSCRPPVRRTCKAGPDPGGSEPARESATQSEASDQASVALDVDGLDVLEEPATLAD